MCVVFDMKLVLEFIYFIFKNLFWFVIDFNNISDIVKFFGIENSGDLIKKLCYFILKNKLFVRVVVEFNRNIKFLLFVVIFDGVYGYRLVVDLLDSVLKLLLMLLVLVLIGFVVIDDFISVWDWDIIVVIDVGYGGYDLGLIGLVGIYEKYIILSIVKKLEDMINWEWGMCVIMICGDDYYVFFNWCFEIVCEKKVDLFIFIYVDVFS